MNRRFLGMLTMCLWLAAPVPAGDLEPRDEDFIVGSFFFDAKGSAAAMAPDGSFVVAWDAYFCCMAARSYTEDLTASWMWDLTPGFPGTPDPVDVTALADDDFVVVWENEDEAYNEVIHAQRLTLSGAPLGPRVEVISATDGSTNRHPTVDAWPSADFLVAWAQDDPNDPGAEAFDIQLASFAASSPETAGLAKAPEGHFMVNTYVTGDQDHPQLSVGPDSSFIVVWKSMGSPDDDSDGLSVQGTWFSPSASPDPQFQVNAFTTGDQDNADVAMAPDGGFLVVWDGGSGETDLDRSIQGRLFGPDRAPLGPDFQVNSYTTGAQSQPAVESIADGSFFVVWRSASGVFGRLVDSSGALLGPELALNSTPGDLFHSPRVAGALNGRFVVTWDSDDDGGEYPHKRRARQFRYSLFSDGFESGNTTAWSQTVP